MPYITELKKSFENLTGQKISIDDVKIKIFENHRGLGFSQFNEALSLLELNRVNENFFQFLVNEELIYDQGSTIQDLTHLNDSIDKFVKLALLEYGNVKYAYKVLSIDPFKLEKAIFNQTAYDEKIYKLRHHPIKGIKPIPENRTHLLGYLSSRVIEQGLQKDPESKKWNELKKESEKFRKQGISNQETYLTYDHMDVYVATSMRMEHEFLIVDENVKEIFLDPNLVELKLRYFNPTQAFCKGRIEKGLSEALMLKRAKCTIYLGQENDTLGKDSELASTLAQGKPVIAYIPLGDEKYVDDLIAKLASINKDNSKKDIILEQLKIFSPDLAWQKESDLIRKCIDNRDSMEEKELMNILYEKVKSHYDKRADVLMKSHPLGIQVNLESGVANGVLVVRTLSDCSKLLKSIVLNKMEFTVERGNEFDIDYIYLRESISNCIFRLQTGDKLLTNSFWNFYLINS